MMSHAVAVSDGRFILMVLFPVLPGQELEIYSGGVILHPWGLSPCLMVNHLPH